MCPHIQATAYNANGLTFNIPEAGSNVIAGNNNLRMCKKGY
jgi:hypothetical protein